MEADTTTPELPEGFSTENHVQSKERLAEYAYTDREHFTSEVFKIEIGNTPKHFGFGECKKLLKKKLKLNPHKIKQIPNINKIYVTFRNENDKLAALQKLDKFQYRGNILEVKNAKPKVDAMAIKRSCDGGTDSSDAVKKLKVESDEVPQQFSPRESIRNSVTRWHDVPYEEQLARKQAEMKNFLCNCRTRLGKLDLDHEVFVWIMTNKAELDGLCCPLQPILPSPVTTKYRNKSEFTISLNTSGEKTVGYRIGKYRDKTCAVEETSGIDILPDKIQEVALKFQEYIRDSNKDTYNPQNYLGHWKQLTVRTTLDGQVMAIVIVVENKDRKEDEELEERESLKRFFLSGKSAGLVTTLLYQVIPTHRASGKEIEPPQVLFGDGYITESLLGLKFRISPDSFFQCNSKAAEVLYSKVGEMLQPGYFKCNNSKKSMEETAKSDPTQDMKKNVILFDVCCGTGTIGLTLASKVSHVVGVELCEQAVEDAKRNARLNGIENCEFHCGKAEDLMPKLVKAHSSNPQNEIIAIVDPPRPGLHNKVIQCLRKCSLLQKIIYVSCNPNSIFNNVIDLCRTASKRMPGLPFLPYFAQPVDLFPQTPHTELIIYFKRTTEGEKDEKMKSESNENSIPNAACTDGLGSGAGVVASKPSPLKA